MTEREQRLLELLRRAYPCVRRIANGGSRTREDLEEAERTLADIKAELNPGDPDEKYTTAADREL